LIKTSQNVLETAATDIKIGASPRAIESYARLSDSITNQFHELVELNKTLLQLYNMSHIEDNLKETNNSVIPMTMTQIVDMISSAQKSSELNRIDAEFKIEEGEVN